MRDSRVDCSSGCRVVLRMSRTRPGNASEGSKCDMSGACARLPRCSRHIRATCLCHTDIGHTSRRRTHPWIMFSARSICKNRCTTRLNLVRFEWKASPTGEVPIQVVDCQRFFLEDSIRPRVRRRAAGASATPRGANEQAMHTEHRERVRCEHRSMSVPRLRGLATKPARMLPQLRRYQVLSCSDSTRNSGRQNAE